MNYIAYYKLLGLHEGAGEEEIRQAYRRLAMKLHPDVNPSPNAHQEFIGIGEAYEMLMFKAKQEEALFQAEEMKAPEDFTSWEDIIQEAREHARKQAEMKFEKLQKEHEAFQKSGLYDVGLALRYGVHFLAIFVAFGLILFPVIVAIVVEFQAFFYLFVFWVLGIFLLLYIYSNRQTWFKLGSFYFKPAVLRELFLPKPVIDGQTCFYCKGLPADGIPFEQTLLKVQDIQLRTNGPGTHQARYKRLYKTVKIPRSRKAYILHLTGSVLKILSILVFAIIIRPGSTLWSLILGAITGGMLSTFLMLVTSTRPKTLYMLNPYTLVKLITWLGFLSLISYRTDGWHIYAGEYVYLTVALLLFFLDIVADPLIRLIFRNRAMTSFLRLPPEERDLLHKGYLYSLEIPVWSTVFPILRWLF